MVGLQASSVENHLRLSNSLLFVFSSRQKYENIIELDFLEVFSKKKFFFLFLPKSIVTKQMWRCQVSKESKHWQSDLSPMISNEMSHIRQSEYFTLRVVHNWRHGIFEIFLTLSPNRLYFITKVLIPSSKNPWTPPPAKTVTSFMDDPLEDPLNLLVDPY